MRTVIEVRGMAKCGKTRMLIKAAEHFFLNSDTPPQTTLELREIQDSNMKRPQIREWEEE